MALRFALDRVLAKKRLSVAELADRTGLSETKLALIRNHEAVAIRLKTLDILCKALNCAPGDLFESDE